MDKEAGKHGEGEVYVPGQYRQMFKAAILEYYDYGHNIVWIKTNPWLNMKILKADHWYHRAIPVENFRRAVSSYKTHIITPVDIKRRCYDGDVHDSDQNGRSLPSQEESIERLRILV